MQIFNKYMKDYIKIGIEKKLISFNEDMSRITVSIRRNAPFTL